jgi:tRNA (adenine57-N1/adenine58-N1)-methyltransferase catalytic subunit
MVKKVLIRSDKKFYWKDGDLHTNYGVVKEEDLKEAKGLIKSHSGKEFTIFEANFIDKLKKIKRGPQTLLLKDLGYIFINSGVTKDSLVVDAGTGCGILATVMAKVAKKVVTYDKNKDNIAISQKNFKYLDVQNVEVKEKDVYEGIEEKDVDILTLDLPEPWRVDTSCVKNGGTIIVYLPTITQVSEFCDKTKDYVVKVVELLEREWYVQGRKVRPKSQMQGHTAFLIIVRKV